ncbi:MAG: gluconate 2-dehydrogenase subunit 3 family protein [Flavobacteriaceae bacterium]
MALGYSVATPTLISILQSCKTEKVLEWTPDFFSKEQGDAIIQLVDIILPKTDTPSASEVQVHLFIDRFMDQVMEKEQQDFSKMVMDAFFNKGVTDSGSEALVDVSSENLESSLAEALRFSPEQEEKYQEEIEAYHMAIMEGKTASLSDGAACHAFATNLRGMTIWGYKGSEYIGEEVLAYLPVPGQYIGCGDLQELSGGKAWSL